MYSIFKNRIYAGGYQLADIQQRVKKLYALGDLSQDQMDELLTLAQAHAQADAERPEILRLLQRISDRVGALEKLVLPQKDVDEGSSGYEAWTAWDGIGDQYRSGAVVLHNGMLWKSVFAGQNVWEPGTQGTENLWVEYTEEVSENV